MTLKSNRIRSFLWTSAIFSALIFFKAFGLENGRQAFEPFGLEAGSIFAGLFFGIFVTVAFTPEKISWNHDSVDIRAFFPGSGEYPWDHLEAYSPFSFWGVNLFLIKFRGRQAYQIWALGFRRVEWNQFQQFLREHHADKKTWIWLGPCPVRFRKLKKP